MLFFKTVFLASFVSVCALLDYESRRGEPRDDAPAAAEFDFAPLYSHCGQKPCHAQTLTAATLAKLAEIRDDIEADEASNRSVPAASTWSRLGRVDDAERYGKPAARNPPKHHPVRAEDSIE